MNINSAIVKLILGVDENFLGIRIYIFFQGMQENGLCKCLIFSLVDPKHKKKNYFPLVVIPNFQS